MILKFKERCPKPIVPEWGNPDVNESFIRACDEFVLRTLLIDRTMTAYNLGGLS